MTLLSGPPPSRTDYVDRITGMIVVIGGAIGSVLFLFWLFH